MVETVLQPIVRIVAFCTVGRVAKLLVLRRIVILYLVTGDAFGFRSRQVAFVTVGTLNYCFVASLQLKSGGGMIERRRFPAGGGVAGGTIVRDSGSSMAGRNGSRVIFLVATVANRGRSS